MNHFVTWTAQRNAKTFDVKRTQGTFIHLSDGTRVDDFVSTSFNSSFGHSHPLIVSAIETQLQRLPIAGPKWAFDLKDEASGRLLKLLRRTQGKIFYTVSGAEAVENALKMARQISGRKIVLARRKSYHGASLGALSVTGDWRNEPHFTVDEWTRRVPEPAEDPDLSQTRKVILEAGPDRIAAFCLEVISGTNGVVIPPKSWWNGIQKLCREFGIFLIADEVLTGFGRTGTAFAFQHFELDPDFVTMSKGITGGYVPFGAVWTSKAVADYYEDQTLACGLTHYAHPLGLAAMSAVLDLFDDSKFCDDLGAKEKMLSEALANMKSLRGVREVRVAGMLAAVEFEHNIESAAQEFFRRRLLVFAKGREVIVAPPLTYERNEFKDALERFRHSIRVLSGD